MRETFGDYYNKILQMYPLSCETSDIPGKARSVHALLQDSFNSISCQLLAQNTPPGWLFGWSSIAALTYVLQCAKMANHLASNNLHVINT